MTIRTAIHPAVWTPKFDAASLIPAVERASAIGFDHVLVPLRRLAEIDPPALAKVFERFKMRPLNTAGQTADADVGSDDHEIRKRGYDRLATSIAMARDMGSSQMNGVLYGPVRRANGPPSAASFQNSAHELGKLAEVAAAAGVRLALEVLNRYETNLVNTVEQALAYREIANHPNLYLHLDTFHMAIEESDPVQALARALPHLAYFELDQSHRGHLSAGSLDLAAWLTPLLRAGYDGLIGVEAFSRSSMSSDHATALAIWRDVFDDGDRVARDAFDLIMRCVRAI